MKKLLLLSLTILLFSCGDSDSLPTEDTFRNIYNYTFWRVDSGIYKISNDKLISFVQDPDTNTYPCISYVEGSWNNVQWDNGGCIYENITVSIIEETSNKLVFRVVSTGGSSECFIGNFYADATITLEALSDALIQISYSSLSADVNDTEILVRIDDSNSSLFIDCTNLFNY